MSRFLGLPYLNVDCGAFASSQAATTALLGSPRGYVGSYQAGELEKAAKHAGGVVLEASDIDHAPVHARTAIADLFLGVLQTGEAQSAIGARIPCAEMIIVFSYNLLNGMDEAVHKKTGFFAETTRHELQDRVVRQTSDFLSGAFQSRMGLPIVFDMLGPDALAAIAERAVREALGSAAVRSDVDMADVVLDEGVGHHILAAYKTKTNTFGARALLTRGREVASAAFTEWLDGGAPGQGRVLRVEPEAGGGVALRPERRRTKPVRRTSCKAVEQRS
jgi:ATP-dependent Clp protease ATP-binding subunit ClpA